MWYVDAMFEQVRQRVASTSDVHAQRARIGVGLAGAVPVEAG